METRRRLPITSESHSQKLGNKFNPGQGNSMFNVRADVDTTAIYDTISTDMPQSLLVKFHNMSDAVCPKRSAEDTSLPRQKTSGEVAGRALADICFEKRSGFCNAFFHFICVGKCPPEVFCRGNTTCPRNHFHIRLWDIYIRLWGQNSNTISFS